MLPPAADAPIGAPSRASRQFEIALAIARSRLEPGSRLELEAAVRAALERRAAVLREALAAAAGDRDAWRAELARIGDVLQAASRPARPARPPASVRKRQADALRRAFGIPRAA